MTWRPVLALLIIAALVGRCSRSEDRYLHRDVRPEEVAGLYKLTPDSAQIISNDAYVGITDPSQRSILIRPDGTCHFSTFTYVARSAVSPSAPVAPLDAECRWTVDRSKRQQLTLLLSVEPPKAAQFYFAEQNGTLLLWQFADDPDDWKYVEYRKERPRDATSPSQ
jgi:hypothetical protein